MGSSIYFLLILLLAMTSTVSSESPLKLQPRASSKEKCGDGSQCINCADVSNIKAGDTQKILDIAEILSGMKLTREEYNDLIVKGWDEIEPGYSANCKSGKCKLKEVAGPGGLQIGVCACCSSEPESGTVKVQVTGYLFALTAMVILLPELFGFFGSYGTESGFSMEKGIGKEEKFAQIQTKSEPEGTPKGSSCGERTIGIGTGPPAAIAVV